MDIENKLSEALMRVAELDGVCPYPDEESICPEKRYRKHGRYIK